MTVEYVDPQVDDCVAQFHPCADCRDALNTLAETSELWFRGQLCGEDHTALECLLDAGLLPCENKHIFVTPPPGTPTAVASELGIYTDDDQLDAPPSGHLQTASDLLQPQASAISPRESQDRYEQEARLALLKLEEFEVRQERLRLETLIQDRDQAWRRLIPGYGTSE